MDYRDIGHITRGAMDLGKVKVLSDGIHFKSSKTGHTLHVKKSDIDEMEWMRVARGYGVKVIKLDGTVTKLDGFKEDDYADLREFSKAQFNKSLRLTELSVKGWNWGEAKFKGSLLSFMVESKPAFEIPLNDVSRVTSGKNEVTLEFHQNEDTPVSLMEMRFHIPSTDGETDPVEEFHQNALKYADVIQATGDSIAEFPEVQILTPRGRYTIKCYPSFLQLHGKTFDYKIPYNTINRIFLLPHNDQRQMFFVLGLDPPIRQGQTRYPFVIAQLPTDEDCDITLRLSEEELEQKYAGKLKRELSGRLYEVFSRVIRILTGRKITVPGNTFATSNNQYGISCSKRATSGFLYPLDKGFIFVHKPAVYIKFEDIASVNFARMTGSAGIRRSFDFDIEMKDGNVHHFSSLMKQDYSRLSQYVADKNIRVKKKQQETRVAYNDELSSDSEHDAYLERMKAQGEDRDSESDDSDYVAKGSGSDDNLEYDSDAHLDSESGEEGGGREVAAKKRKKPSAPKPPAKRKKEEGGGAKRKTKDPNAPKKPLTAFILWLQKERPSLKAKYPKYSVVEIAKKAGELWKQLQDKSEWTREAARLSQAYTKELAAYKASGGGSTPQAKKKMATPTKSKSRPSKKESTAISAEFVVSSNEEDQVESEPEGADQVESEPEPAPKAKPAVRSMRSRGGGDDDVGSLPTDESDAELTSGEEEVQGDDSESESD